MNILIKNADFSEVSIGQVETKAVLEKKCIFTNAYLLATEYLSYYGSGIKVFAVDVSSLNQREITITGLLGVTGVLGIFYADDCPSTDVTFNDAEEAVDYRTNNLTSKISAIKPDTSTGKITETVIVPENAKTLIVSAGNIIDESSVKYSLID